MCELKSARVAVHRLRYVRAEERTSCCAHELGPLVCDELTYALRPLPLARARLLGRGLEGHESAPRGVEKPKPRALAAQPTLVERHTVLPVPYCVISFTRSALRGPALHDMRCGIPLAQARQVWRLSSKRVNRTLLANSGTLTVKTARTRQRSETHDRSPPLPRLLRHPRRSRPRSRSQRMFEHSE